MTLCKELIGYVFLIQKCVKIAALDLVEKVFEWSGCVRHTRKCILTEGIFLTFLCRVAVRVAKRLLLTNANLCFKKEAFWISL